MVVPKIQHVNSDTLKTTLAIIKPDSMKYGKKILQNFIKNGFHIIQRKKFQLSPELAAEFYKEYEKCKSYMLLVLNLSNGPIEAVILTKVNAIYDLLDLVGPEKPSQARCCNPQTLRSIFGDCEDDFKNAIHASFDARSARREINFFFPNFIVEPIACDTQICCSRRDVIETLIAGLFDVTKSRPEELKSWLANWLHDNNPNRPVISTDYISPVCTPCVCDTLQTNEFVSGLDQHKHDIDVCNDLNPCSEFRDQNEKIDLHKLLCCCNADIQPTEMVNCPICDKIIVYSVPCGEGAKKKIQPLSNSSTTTSLSSASSDISSCKCSIQEKVCSSSSSLSCNCDNEKNNADAGSARTCSTCTSTSTTTCDCDNK